MLPYEIHLAGRNLSRHPWHTAGMALGLALAVLVMVYIPSTLASFYDDMIDRSVEQTSAHITIWPPEQVRGQATRTLRDKYGPDALLHFDDRSQPRPRHLNGHRALMASLEEVPGVVASTSFVEGEATVTSGRITRGIRLAGIEPDEYARVVNIRRHFEDSRIPRLGPGDVIIGWRIAEELRVHMGDQVFVATPTGRRQLRIVGIFRSGHYERDMSLAFTPMRTAQRLFAMGNEVSAVAVRGSDLDQADVLAAAIAQRFPHKVRNWKSDNAALLAEVAMVQRIALFINILVAAVATVGMANVFSLFVLSRRKELAILRAIGASRPSLRAILLTEACFIWVVGIVVGVTLALTVMAYEQMNPMEVAAELYGIGHYATRPKAQAFATTAVLTLLTMLVAAWRSGQRAAKLNPAEVIFGK